MGLQRLYWIPEGYDARHGAYVSYRAEELHAIVALEAHRAGVVVVGEDLGTPCRGTIANNAHPQAFWFFSVNACGAYGFGDLTILHSGRTEPLGEVTLTSNGKLVKVGKGSAMLLRVDGSGPEEAQARTTPSRETGQ